MVDIVQAIETHKQLLLSQSDDDYDTDIDEIEGRHLWDPYDYPSDGY